MQNKLPSSCNRALAFSRFDSIVVHVLVVSSTESSQTRQFPRRMEVVRAIVKRYHLNIVTVHVQILDFDTTVSK